MNLKIGQTIKIKGFDVKGSYRRYYIPAIIHGIYKESPDTEYYWITFTEEDPGDSNKFTIITRKGGQFYVDERLHRAKHFLNGYIKVSTKV